MIDSSYRLAVHSLYITDNYSVGVYIVNSVYCLKH